MTDADYNADDELLDENELDDFFDVDDFDEDDMDDELDQVIEAMQQDFPEAFDYDFQADNQAHIYDADYNEIAVISEEKLTAYWNAIN